jgi:hypothetical protein
MRRTVGITLLVAAGIATAIFLALGTLGSERGRATTSGRTPFGSWHVTDVNIDPNWWIVVPLVMCFLVGLLCVLLPGRR